MYDRINIPATPRNARRLVAMSKVNDQFHVPERIRIMAEEREIDLGLPALTDAAQFIIDNNNRCALMHLANEHDNREKYVSVETLAQQKLFPMVILINPYDLEGWVEIIRAYANSHPEYTIDVVTNRPESVIFEKDQTNLRVTGSNIRIGVKGSVDSHVTLIDAISEYGDMLDPFFPMTTVKSAIIDMSVINYATDKPFFDIGNSRSLHQKHNQMHLNILREVDAVVQLYAYEDLYDVKLKDDVETCLGLRDDRWRGLARNLLETRVIPGALPIEHDSITKRMETKGYRFLDEHWFDYLPLAGVSTDLCGDRINGRTK